MLHFFGTLCNYCYCVQFSASYQRHGEVDIFSSLELMVCRGDGCWIICSSLIYSTIFMACLTVYQALFLGLRLIGRSWPRQHLVEKTPKERTATWASPGAFRERGAVHVAFTRGGRALTVTSSGVRKSPGAVIRPAFQQEVHSPTPALVPSRELEQSSHPEALKHDTSPAPALVSPEAQEQTLLPAFPVEESPPAPALVSSGEVELSLHTKPQKGEPSPAPLPAPAGDSELLLCPAAPKDERPAAPALVTAANLEFSTCLPPLQGWPARDCPSGLLPLPQF